MDIALTLALARSQPARPELKLERRRRFG